MVSIRQLEERRARYAEWFAALGLDPDTMPMDAMNSFTISRPEGSTPTVTAEVYETNDGGTVRHPLVRSRRTIDRKSVV